MTRGFGSFTAMGCLLVLALALGCSTKPKRIKPPTIDPVAAGTGAVEANDKDGDGALSLAELKAGIPGIMKNVALYDTNKDKKVTAEEITERIQTWERDKVALMQFTCRIEMDNQPLQGATVKLVPEAFLGDAVKPAEGETDKYGNAILTISEEFMAEAQRGKNLSAVHVGIFKVEISHPARKIPAKFNSQTTLGQDVSLDTMGRDEIVYRITSR